MTATDIVAELKKLGTEQTKKLWLKRSSRSCSASRSRSTNSPIASNT